MLTVTLPSDQTATIMSALTKAGDREIGGIVMGEHVGQNEFTIREITVHRRGSFSSFIRRIEDALGKMQSFFRKTNYHYLKFNYLGEWHSHPLFEPVPSSKDDTSMLEIIQDHSVGANFVVLLIVKLDPNGELVATVHTYLPDGTRHLSDVKIKH